MAAQRKTKITKAEQDFAPITESVKDSPSDKLFRQMVAEERLRKARDERARLMRISTGPLATVAGKKRLKPHEKEMVDRVMALQEVGMDGGDGMLEANSDVIIVRNTQSTVQAARREDAFDALRPKMEPGAYDAARRLEADMRTRRGEDDRGQRLVVVNGQAGDKGSMDRRLDAARRVDAVLQGVGERDAWLLTELIYPAQRRESWRLHVAYITGETNEHAQGATVRSACANLARSYDSKGYVERLRVR